MKGLDIKKFETPEKVKPYQSTKKDKTLI